MIRKIRTWLEKILQRRLEKQKRDVLRLRWEKERWKKIVKDNENKKDE